MTNYTVVSSIFCKLHLRVFDFLTFILQGPQFCKKYTLGLSKIGIFSYTLGLGVRPNILTPRHFLLEVPPPRAEIHPSGHGTQSRRLGFYEVDQTDREMFESILEEALGSEDFSGHLSTSDLDRYADFIITALHTAVDKAILKSKSVRSESNPISNETLALIKEKRKLRRQYS